MHGCSCSLFRRHFRYTRRWRSGLGLAVEAVCEALFSASTLVCMCSDARRSVAGASRVTAKLSMDDMGECAPPRGGVALVGERTAGVSRGGMWSGRCVKVVAGVVWAGAPPGCIGTGTSGVASSDCEQLSCLRPQHASELLSC